MAADSPGGYDEWAISLLFVIFLCITLLWKALLHTVEGALRASPGLMRVLENLKDEVLTFGLLSLLLPFLQIGLSRICLPDGHGTRRLLASSSDTAYACAPGSWQPYNGNVVHDTHVLLFMIAVAHVIYACATMVMCLYRIRRWLIWEECVSQRAFKRVNPRIVESLGSTNLESWWHAIVNSFTRGVSEAVYLGTRRLFMARLQEAGSVDARNNHVLESFPFHAFLVERVELSLAQIVHLELYMWLFAILIFLVPMEYRSYVMYGHLVLAAVILLVCGAKLHKIVVQLAARSHFVFRKEALEATVDAIVSSLDDPVSVAEQPAEQPRASGGEQRPQADNASVTRKGVACPSGPSDSKRPPSSLQSPPKAVEDDPGGRSSQTSLLRPLGRASAPAQAAAAVARSSGAAPAGIDRPHLAAAARPGANLQRISAPVEGAAPPRTGKHSGTEDGGGTSAASLRGGMASVAALTRVTVSHRWLAPGSGRSTASQKQLVRSGDGQRLGKEHHELKYRVNPNKPIDELFWLGRPSFTLQLFQFAYFSVAFSIAELLSNALLHGDYASSDKSVANQMMITMIILALVLVLTVHSAWFVLPVYALCMLASDEAFGAAAAFIQSREQLRQQAKPIGEYLNKALKRDSLQRRWNLESQQSFARHGHACEGSQEPETDADAAAAAAAGAEVGGAGKLADKKAAGAREGAELPAGEETIGVNVEAGEGWPA